MRLQTDPTVIYGMGDDYAGNITRADLREATPYNTYVIDGLPPTPIAIPGRAALEAVANPSTTNDLFFVADGTGGHVFAETLDEHNENVRRWREIERQREAEAREAADGQDGAAPDGEKHHYASGKQAGMQAEIQG